MSCGKYPGEVDTDNGRQCPVAVPQDQVFQIQQCPVKVEFQIYDR